MNLKNRVARLEGAAIDAALAAALRSLDDGELHSAYGYLKVQVGHWDAEDADTERLEAGRAVMERVRSTVAEHGEGCGR